MVHLCGEEGNPRAKQWSEGDKLLEAILLQFMEFKHVVKEYKAVSQNKSYRSLYQGEAVHLKGQQICRENKQNCSQIPSVDSCGPRVLRAGEEAAPA